MNVGELKQLLNQFDDSLIVMYEEDSGGLHTIDHVYLGVNEFDSVLFLTRDYDELS